MCLGVPGKIIELKEHNVGVVDIQGNQVSISVALTPEVEVGQHVLVHAGFAMEIIDEEEALKTMALLEEMMSYGEMSIDEPR
ncbi:MAG TPA: HypC/HybG/HupF family hydrogenase formation chaperone [Syntrophomonadaceae bacterium]|nr:HypC/HybG/HupF family hydrogenase formation chaperone [Syntrophomonadaceae bacterium]